jgi:pyridoxal phosphate enzyme (YggS family)
VAALSVDPSAVAARVAAARARIAAVAAGRDVALLAVTKGFGPDAVAAAAAAGCRAVGENYAQELLTKRDAVAAAGVDVHFIGRLQTNKIRHLAGLVAVWESVDRPRLVDEIARRVPGARVFVQVDATVETGKGGCPVADVPALVERAVGAGLAVDGVMAVGPTSGDPALTRDVFARVVALADELGLRERSIGMSGDLEIAVEAGSTEVRLGTALFGARR